MVWSLSHGHIPALASMAVSIAPSELAGCQHRALCPTATGPRGIMEVLVNYIEMASSVIGGTNKNRWQCLYLQVKRS